MTTTEKHTCVQRVYGTSRSSWSFKGHACGKGAKFHEPPSRDAEPVWFCGTHAPSQIKVREDKKLAIWRGERERRDRSTNRMQSIAALLTERFGTEVQAVSHYERGEYRGMDLVVTAHKIPREWLDKISS